MFKDNPFHDFTSHAADMYRYAAIGESLMGNERGAILTARDNSTPVNPSIKDGIISQQWPAKAKDWRYQ